MTDEFTNGYHVLVVHNATGRVVQRDGPLDRRGAERAEDVASRELDHARYHTEIDSAAERAEFRAQFPELFRPPVPR